MSKLIKVPDVVVAKCVEGIDMGVLTDGTPFLTGRSLAKLCDVAASTIIERSQEWLAGRRDGKLAKHLLEQDFNESSLYIKATHKGRAVHAYPDDVCMLVLEYYAFEVGGELAKGHYRRLARKTLRDYIYTFTGYDPRLAIPPAWRYFHDRMLLNLVPPGFFSVFREMADIVIAGIRAGLVIDAGTVPDISVGRIWASHWDEDHLQERFGERVKFEHYYPPYFPQADSNPQDVWAYPVDALGEFRRWMHETYLPDKFPGYLNSKVKRGEMTEPAAAKVLEAVKRDMTRFLPAKS